MIIDFNQDWYFQNKEGKKISVNLPHDAMIHEERSRRTNNGNRSGYYPGGCYQYSKRFTLSQDIGGKQILVRFEGAYGYTTVTINGQELCQHMYGFTSFDVDVTKVVTSGENIINVQVDNSYTPNCRWYSGSGLIRPVFLIIRSENYIEDVSIETLSINPVEIEVRAQVHMGSGSMVKILDGDKCIYQGSTGRIRLPEAKPWSADAPHLYRAVFWIETDTVEQKFGIRQLTWSAKQGFCINGKETKLKGCCLHSDNGILGACTYPDAEFRKVRILKENGYNAIRSAHNPCSRELLEACDALGMYVIDELYDGWYIPKTYHDSARYFYETWKDSVRAMVEKDKNHPSVIMYSIGNEVTEPTSEEGILTGKRLVEEIKKLDGKRPVTCGLNIMLMKWNATFTDQGEYKKEHLPDCERKDEGGSAFFNAMMLKLGAAMGIFVKGKKSDRLISGLADCLDIVGYNYGEYRYKEEGKANPDRILVGSETLVGRQWYNWKHVKKYPYLIGDFVWTGFDYIGETNIGQWQYGNRTGLPLLYGAGTIDITGKPDAQMAYQQSVWGERKTPYLGVRPLDVANVKCLKRNWRMTDVMDSWTWHGYEGRKTIAEVFTDAPYVKLLQDGKEIGMKKVKKNKVSFSVIYEPGTLTAISLNKKKEEIARGSLTTAGLAKGISVSMAKSVLSANGQDLCYMDICIVDEKGHPVQSEEWEISIELPEDSKVELAGFGSANPATDEEFTAKTHRTYYGRAQAVFRAGYRTGDTEVKICATGKGIHVAKKLSCVENTKKDFYSI